MLQSLELVNWYESRKDALAISGERLLGKHVCVLCNKVTLLDKVSPTLINEATFFQTQLFLASPWFPFIYILVLSVFPHTPPDTSTWTH